MYFATVKIKSHSDFNNFVCETAMRLGPNFSEIVKGKLSLGARILQLGGVKRVFDQIFGVREGEKLLKASQCYLWTTAGPIAGLLFISTQRVAFFSERSIKFSCPNGELVRIHYKVGLLTWLSLCQPISLSMMFEHLSKFIFFCAGLYPTKKDKESQPKWECEKSFSEVHGNCYRW